MKKFLGDDFLLETETARVLYHDYARDQPIFDYHCHLPVEEIAQNRNFANLTQMWLNGDHYKWRAMRANGVNEELITGRASDEDKFHAWAATVPKTLRNPLYHWTHMELKTPFGIDDLLLSEDTAAEVYQRCNELLATPEFSTCGILKRMKVRVVCTTDDPIDSLEHHQAIAAGSSCSARVLPAFRPDKAMAVEDQASYNGYLALLEQASGCAISSYDELLDALKARHDYFHQQGCRLSDHGLEQPFADDFGAREIEAVFCKVRSGQELEAQEVTKFKSAILLDLARMDADKDWTQQFHIGALRNNNSAAMRQLGPDTGYDSIGDFDIARPLSRLLDRLASDGKLARTILYNLNPRDNDLFATMIGNFQDGSVPGKMQFGSGWWFNDQKEGMIAQINSLSNMGLLSRFVGMLTDSRSFLSYTRHEYFRRILCNLFGNDIEKGELPDDLPLVGSTIQDICYGNALNYFGFEVGDE